MIRHIVFFKMKPETGKEDAEALAESLKALKEKTEGLIKECVVAFDVVRSDSSYDILLNSVFDSLEDLQKYQIHPEHVKVVVKIKQICSSIAKVDYEIGNR